MQRHPTDPPDEEIFEATKERSHRTVAGIEVVEYEQSENEQDPPDSATTNETGSPDPGDLGGVERLEWLKRERNRLTDKLARAREELENQKRDQLDKTSKLLGRINTLANEIREKDNTIDRLTAIFASYEL